MQHLHWKCVKRFSELPKLACDCSECDWYVRDHANKNCFWVLCESLQDNPLSDEEIARLEGISVEEVEKVTASAFQKLRNNPDAIQLLQGLRSQEGDTD